MKIKRTLALALTFAIAMSLLVFPSSAAGFGDTGGHWAEAAIDRWQGYGIVQGDGVNFRPSASMIVGDFAIVLNNLMGYTVRAENTFADLTGNEYYADAVLRLKAAGILEGDGTNANARETITRERATVLMARALGIQPVENASLGAFVDGSTASDWSAGYIQAMADKGIIQGVGNNTLALARSIDRASVMTILDRAISAYVNEDGATVTGAQKGIVLVAADNVTIENADISGSLLVAPAAAGKLSVTDTAAGEIILNSDVSVTLKGIEAETISVQAEGAALALDDAAVGTVAVNAENADITIAGQSAVTDIAVNAANADVKVSDATVENVALNAAAPSVSLGSGARVRTIDVAAQATSAKITVAQGAEASALNTAADNVAISGAGKVENVNVSAGEGVKVDTEGTKVTVGENASDVTAGGETVKPGESITTEGKPSSGGGSGGSSGGSTTTTVSGVYGVHPFDQSNPENPVKDVKVTAEATKNSSESFVRVKLSTDKAVSIHQNANSAMGAWVGVAFKAPEGVDTFKYYFAPEANSGTALTEGTAEEMSELGDGSYAIFFINASASKPKTHIELQWGDDGAVTKYVVDLSGVKLDTLKPEVTVSTHEMPAGVDSTGTGLAFDGSTSAMVSGKAEATQLTQQQVAAMGGGGEYTVYYTVPKAGLAFDSIVRTINGGAPNTWMISSTTGAEEGGGWWTVDDNNYYFKWGAAYAVKDENGAYQMKDGGVYSYKLQFMQGGNIVAEHAFTVDFSKYTIEQPAALEAQAFTQWQEGWTEGSHPSAEQQIHRDEAHELDLRATLSQSAVKAMGGQFVEYVQLDGLPEFTSIERTLTRDGEEMPGSETLQLSGTQLGGEDGRYARDEETTYLKLGTMFAKQGSDKIWTLRGDGSYTERLVFKNGETVVATAEYVIDMSGVTIEAPAALEAQVFTQWQEGWEEGTFPSAGQQIHRDEAHELALGATLSQEDVAAMNGQFVEYVQLNGLPEFTSVNRTLLRDGEEMPGSETLELSGSQLGGEDGRYAKVDETTYLKLGTIFASNSGEWTKRGVGNYTETLVFMNGDVVVATVLYTIDMSGVIISPAAVGEQP